MRWLFSWALRRWERRSVRCKQEVPFTGTFRLPFALDDQGMAKEPDSDDEDMFYLGDDGQLIPVQPFERVFGFPPVRLEVTF